MSSDKEKLNKSKDEKVRVVYHKSVIDNLILRIDTCFRTINETSSKLEHLLLTNKSLEHDLKVIKSRIIDNTEEKEERKKKRIENE